MRQYSWRKYVKKKVCFYIHTLKPLKTKKEEKKLKFKRLGATSYQNHSDVIGTSLLPSRQKSEGESQQCSVIHDNTERNVSQYTNNIHKTRKEEGKLRFKRPGSTNCRNHSDVIVTELDSDVIIRDIDVNKPVARKRYAPKKHSLVHTKEFLKSTLSMCSQTFTKVVLMLAVVISILGGGLNIKLPRRICTSGLASVVCQECESGNNSNSAHPLSLAILRKSAAASIDINKGLCSRINKVMFLNDSKQLTGSMKILQNTIRRGVTILSNRSPSSKLASPCAPYRCHGYSTRSPTTFARDVLAGKRFDTYIFPSVDFWASRVYYLDTYTVNLESDDNLTVFYDLVYRYIYTFYRSWSSCNWATYSRVILYTLVYFSLNSIVSVIRIHDKYQSLILIGLALTGKASSGIQYILFHFRSYWRGWRPLVTTWAGCIKEGIEPRISQKWLFPSHAQVSVSLCSLLLLLSCFCFYCSYCYYYYYYGYLLAKGFYYSSGYEYKPGHFNKQKLLPCHMLCFSFLLLALPFLSLSSDDIISVEGYPTHIISPALFLAFASLSFSFDDIVSVEGYPTHIISPALLLAFACLSLHSDDIISVEGYPTHIISPALLLAFASLSLPSDDIISVEGYPTHIISPALLLAFAFLSLPSDDIISVEGYPTHIISPALLFALCLSFLSLSLF